MSMEISVFFHGALPDKSALARAIKELGFPITIPHARGPLDTHKGFLPMRLKREKSGVEFDVFDGRDNIEEVANGCEVDPAFDRSANFRWGGDRNEMLCAVCASAALARLTGGVVLGDYDDYPLSPDEAIATARDHVAEVGHDKKHPPRTRPADIKRYLKPLLKTRDDLALVGRLLVIRPVRHFVRGVLLDESFARDVFDVWRYIEPLYDPTGERRLDDQVLFPSGQVWQPHFQPLLMDVLAEDVFPSVAAMTTFNQFAETLVAAHNHSAAVIALALSGALDRAVDYVRDLEQENEQHWKDWAAQQHAFLSRDIDEICAEYHAKEAETVKAMQLEAIWEPTPFPVELPVHQRGSNPAEPEFPRMPWVARPADLLQDAPDRIGDVRFAKEALRRHGRAALVVPLAQDEAEQRHQDDEPYVLATRRADGLVIVLGHWRGRDRLDPIRPSRPWRKFYGIYLQLYASGHFADISFNELPDNQERLQLASARVYERQTGHQLWSCSTGFENGTMFIEDRRGPPRQAHSYPVLTDAQWELIECDYPAFGAFEDVVARALAWLHSADYGEIIQPRPSGFGT